jgi:hypothetical protein
LDSCKNLEQGNPDMNFGSRLIPLLKNPRIKTIFLGDMHHHGTRSSDYPSIKAAFASNEGLETLTIGDRDVPKDEFMNLLQGIAAAPKIRTLNLDIRVSPTVLQREVSKRFANALADCQNNTLEEVLFVLNYTSLGTVHGSWRQDVNPMLQFNRDHRQFQNCVSGLDGKQMFMSLVLSTFPNCQQAREQEEASRRADGKLLMQGLMHAEHTNNHHLRFWLVRNHAGNLQIPGSGGEKKRGSSGKKREPEAPKGPSWKDRSNRKKKGRKRK